MTSALDRYAELLALTQLYLLQEHAPSDRLLAESETYLHFREYAARRQAARARQWLACQRRRQNYPASNQHSQHRQNRRQRRPLRSRLMQPQPPRRRLGCHPPPPQRRPFSKPRCRLRRRLNAPPCHCPSQRRRPIVQTKSILKIPPPSPWKSQPRQKPWLWMICAKSPPSACRALPS